jgi:hypothetical protein
MRFIRMKLKTLKVTDNDLLSSMIDKGFQLSVGLPLPDVYRDKIDDQWIKLSNYDVISMNEFAFTSLNLYNFKVNEKTFIPLANAKLQIMIEGLNVHGEMSMNKLLLAHNYQLKCVVPLTKTI